MDADVAPTPPRRALTVPRFSRAPSTGVWYYHVNIAVHAPAPSAAAPTANPSAADGPLPPVDAAVPSASPSADYSVLRRYNDFLELYLKIQELVDAASDRSPAVPSPPPFPEKESIPPSLLGSLWRLSTPRPVLEHRRAAFEALLQWIERHPTARRAEAFADFLGPPPQEQDGYTSLKEYSAPHWLTAVELAAARGKDKDKEQRRRRAYTMDVLEGRRGSVSSNSGSVKSEPPRRSPPLALAAVASEAASAGDDRPAVDRTGGRAGPPVLTLPDLLPTDSGEPETEPEMECKPAAARTEGSRRPQRSQSRVLLADPRRSVRGQRTP